MLEIPNTCQVIEIANEVLKIKAETDWIAIFALIISIIALGWQYTARKKETKLQRWNALYPHRLKCYIKFYDILYQLENYDGKNEEGIDILNTITNCHSVFEELLSEAKVLFDKRIQNQIFSICQSLKEFTTNPPEVESVRNEIIGLEKEYDWKNIIHLSRIQEVMYQKLSLIQYNIKKVKNDTSLQQKFLETLKLEGQEDE